MRTTNLIFLVTGLASINLPLNAGILLPDQADYTFTSDTTLTGETFNRPVENGTAPPNTLSDFADAVVYDTFTFEVTTAGIYDLTIIPADFSFNSYLFLYQTLFDPENPLTNVLLGESNADGSSNLAATLDSGTTYIAVVTGFSNFDGGPYSGEITEEAAASAPEPSGVVLLVSGMLFLVLKETSKRIGG